jgi:hypothetical protein
VGTILAVGLPFVVAAIVLAAMKKSK